MNPEHPRAILNAQKHIILDSKLKKELDETPKQEEMLWFQKSREEWIKSELNTKYYHAATMIR